MDPSQIDALILSEAGERWMKVAKMIGVVVEAFGRDLPFGDEGCEIVSRRIEVLVRDGLLEAQGDIRKWRFSEIRLRAK